MLGGRGPTPPSLSSRLPSRSLPRTGGARGASCHLPLWLLVCSGLQSMARGQGRSPASLAARPRGKGAAPSHQTVSFLSAELCAGLNWVLHLPGPGAGREPGQSSRELVAHAFPRRARHPQRPALLASLLFLPALLSVLGPQGAGGERQGRGAWGICAHVPTSLDARLRSLPAPLFYDSAHSRRGMRHVTQLLSPSLPQLLAGLGGGLRF